MSIRRLLLLNHRQWSEHRRGYYIGMLAIAVFLLLLFLITWHFRDSFAGDVNRGIFLLGLFVGGAVFASSLLKDLRSTAKGIWLIGLPASVGEKMFIIFLYAVILYLAYFLFAFYAMEGLFQWLVYRDETMMARTDLSRNGFYYFLFTFVTTQSLIILGSLVFKKGALLKTILIMIAAFAILNETNNMLLGWITGEQNINGGTLFSYFQFDHAGENVYVNLPPLADRLTSLFFYFLLPVVLYYVNYLKLREAEL